MVKKIITIIYIALVVVFGSLLVFINKEVFQETTIRLLTITDYKNLKCFFENYTSVNEVIYEETIKEVTDIISEVVTKIITPPQKSFEEIALTFITNLLDFTLNFIIYFANIGINVILAISIYLHETFSATKLKIKKSLPAKIYLLIFTSIAFIIKKIIFGTKYIFKLLSIHRRFIALNIALYLLTNGILYKITTELLIFIIVYIYKAIQSQTYLLISDFMKYLFLFIYPFLKQVPSYIWIITLIILTYLKAISKAEFRLKQNHERLKEFAKDKLTQTTFINGPPGSGKTLLNVSLTLASEENYIDELELKLLNYEIKFPYLNFATIRNNPDNSPGHHEYTITLSFLKDRKSYLISNYAIYSPYFKDYSKIFDFNFMRKNMKTDVYALEEYIIISLSEIDKEYNSHDDMKKVGSEGAATFFSTISHDLKRHVKIFCDYQLKDQVPLRIRGNSEYFYDIANRKKKYPLLLYLYYLPFIGLAKLLRTLIKKYETTRPFINNKTKRKTVSKYKRNDESLLYVILKQLAYANDKICDYFDHYWYFKIKGDLSMQDGASDEIKNICINICDLSIENMALYDSTFLSYAYEEKKNKAFKNLACFTKLTPPIDELTKCNSHFYNKLNGLEKNQKSTDLKKDAGDEFLDVPN